MSVKLDRFATLHLKKGEASLKTCSETVSTYLFISHAHLDHIERSNTQSMEAVCSEETFLLSTLRGLKIKRTDSNPFTLLDSGHILGSKAIFIDAADGGILYTGDVNTSPMGSLLRQKFPKVHSLIIESNYGHPSLVFPPKRELLREIVDYVCEAIRNRPLVLMGYPLGKSQHLQMLLDPVLQDIAETYASPSIAGYNEIYRLFSIKISEKKVFSSQSSELPKDCCWALYYPNLSGRNAFLQILKRKYGAVLISFSGRSLLGDYEKMLGVDKAFPLSDHADFNGLLEVVRETVPEKVFTVHGFSKEFSKELRKIGYDAHTLL
ncbi:MAG: MBL fold metallo-hydrolase [Thermoproteota archaeon]